MKIHIYLFVLCTSLLSSPGWAEPDLEPLARALAVIDQIPTKAQLIALGADAEGRALLSLATDDRRPAYVRIRAVSFLAWFDSPRTRVGLEALVKDELNPLVELRIQAQRALRVAASAARAPAPRSNPPQRSASP